MARGQSGRIVLEVDPSLKNELYSLLAQDGVTLKDWFLERAEKYISRKTAQLPLIFNNISENTRSGD